MGGKVMKMFEINIHVTDIRENEEEETISYFFTHQKQKYECVALRPYRGEHAAWVVLQAVLALVSSHTGEVDLFRVNDQEFILETL